MENTPEHSKQYPCPQCNAELVYSATQGRMVCSFCGYKAPVAEAGSMTEVHTQTEIDQAVVESIEEHELARGLEMSAEQEGWGTETRTFKCNGCNAMITAEPNVAATVCPFCGSHHVLAQKGSSKVLKPESVLPFEVDRPTAEEKFRTWLGRGWFRPNAVKRIATNAEAQLQGIYLPFWTFDAQTFSRWQAEAGHYYYETERYRVNVEGRTETRTREVQKVRWEPASGSHDEFFDDVLVYATRSVEEDILHKIYPYDTSKLVPYRPQYLAGWRAEEYQVELQDAWEMGQGVIRDRIQNACGRAVPGDTYRNLRVQSRFEDMTFKHTLLPVWIASYRYSNKVYNFMVNGQTGKVQGEAPISWWKVLLTVLIVLLLLACIFGAMILFEEASGGSSSMLQPAVQWIAVLTRAAVSSV